VALGWVQTKTLAMEPCFLTSKPCAATDSYLKTLTHLSSNESKFAGGEQPTTTLLSLLVRHVIFHSGDCCIKGRQGSKVAYDVKNPKWWLQTWTKPLQILFVLRTTKRSVFGTDCAERVLPIWRKYPKSSSSKNDRSTPNLVKTGISYGWSSWCFTGSSCAARDVAEDDALDLLHGLQASHATAHVPPIPSPLLFTRHRGRDALDQWMRLLKNEIGSTKLFEMRNNHWFGGICRKRYEHPLHKIRHEATKRRGEHEEQKPIKYSSPG